MKNKTKGNRTTIIGIGHLLIYETVPMRENAGGGMGCLVRNDIA